MLREPLPNEGKAEYVHAMWQQEDVVQAHPSPFARRTFLEELYDSPREAAPAKPEPLGLSTVKAQPAASEAATVEEPALAEDDPEGGGVD